MMDSRPGSFWPASESELAQRVRGFDWSATPLGPIDGWAPELKSGASFVLESRFPAALVAAAGLVTIYNDAFRPMLGRKGAALGQSLAEIWSEAWHEVGPLAERALAGEATSIDDLPIIVERSGQQEQACFTVSCTPLRSAEGSVLGIILAALATTRAVPAQSGLHLGDEIAEAKLSAVEERLTTTLSMQTVGVMFWDEDMKLTDVNQAFSRMTGFSREEAIGKTWQELTPPEFHPASENALAELRSRGEITPFQKQYVRKDGSRFWGLFAMSKLDGGGVEFVLDITDRKETERALDEARDRFRKFGEASQDILWMRDAQTLQWTYLTRAFEAIYGLSCDEALTGDDYRNWLDLIEAEDRDLVKEQVRRLRNGESVEFEYRIRRQNDDKVRWLRDTDFPMCDEAGNIVLFGGIGQDITDEKRAQERMTMLVAELQHRVRNVLAMIRSMIRRTSTTKSDVTEFVQHLEGRIEAMARTQTLLTRSPGKGIDLEDLVLDEMLAQAADARKFALSGPAVSLPPKAAEVLTLAVHELATNSVKYGVLGQSKGRVAVSWRSENLDGQHVLKITWRETGLTLDRDPDQRRGFGTELITRRVPYELNGEGLLIFEKGALTATIEFPVEQGYSILETDPARWMRGAL